MNCLNVILNINKEKKKGLLLILIKQAFIKTITMRNKTSQALKGLGVYIHQLCF